MPFYILCDPAYPILLSVWLIKAFLEHHLMPQKQKYFNHLLSRVRMMVENAFVRLKGRLRCLLKRIDCHLSNIILIISE